MSAVSNPRTLQGAYHALKRAKKANAILDAADHLKQEMARVRAIDPAIDLSRCENLVAQKIQNVTTDSAPFPTALARADQETPRGLNNEGVGVDFEGSRVPVTLNNCWANVLIHLMSQSATMRGKVPLFEGQEFREAVKALSGNTLAMGQEEEDPTLVLQRILGDEAVVYCFDSSFAEGIQIDGTPEELVIAAPKEDDGQFTDASQNVRFYLNGAEYEVVSCVIPKSGHYVSLEKRGDVFYYTSDESIFRWIENRWVLVEGREEKNPAFNEKLGNTPEELLSQGSLFRYEKKEDLDDFVMVHKETLQEVQAPTQKKSFFRRLFKS